MRGRPPDSARIDCAPKCASVQGAVRRVLSPWRCRDISYTVQGSQAASRCERTRWHRSTVRTAEPTCASGRRHEPCRREEAEVRGIGVLAPLSRSGLSSGAARGRGPNDQRRWRRANQTRLAARRGAAPVGGCALVHAVGALVYERGNFRLTLSTAWRVRSSSLAVSRLARGLPSYRSPLVNTITSPMRTAIRSTVESGRSSKSNRDA